MSTLAEIAAYIVRTLGSLYLLLVLLRFLFQLVRADFYNPISQFVAKATNPPLMPLRKVIPGVLGVDLASLVLALIVQFLVIQLILILAGVGFYNPVQVLLWSIVALLSLLFNIYFWGLLIVIIASWVAPHSGNPALILVRQIIEPAMRPIRKVIPPLGGIDITPIFAFMALTIINRYIIIELARSLRMPAILILGG